MRLVCRWDGFVVRMGLSLGGVCRWDGFVVWVG